ncbi:toll/interleukin-1 receptor domain-containing protein [Bradyrhizobium sp. th.b2]|uniref:toll/interleukin-1 receptor domain-containing protein n=1 Tax=Bradyrhizobium sp. th-b2 TaxID=172088 RepID=UPI00041B8725|nr:toll/interleukin-1 receptor domain-containing protein [Bradyrhizobium sp. th.b2]
MAVSTKPFLAIYVAWHPSLADGAQIGRRLFQHYRRDLYQNIAGGSGVPVLYRFEPLSGSKLPLEIDFNEAQTNAIILLVDSNWTEDEAWAEWARHLSDRADASGLTTLIFPIAIDPSGIKNALIPDQSVRWFEWSEEAVETKYRRLTTALSYQFCRMLRQYLEHLKRPEVDEPDLIAYLKRVDVFLSHSKHDGDGTAIALQFRKFVQDGGYDAFFDVFDIPIGLRFNKVLLEKVKVSAVVAIHTDSYSSREWCRREMIQANMFHVPLVVANCMKDVDERGFPYMANVPIVRMDPEKRDRIDVVVSRLMDEVLKDFLWRCRVTLLSVAASKSTSFLPRPPELIVLTAMRSADPHADTLIYPDPPIGAEELHLFQLAAPGVKLLSVTEWLAGAAK